MRSIKADDIAPLVANAGDVARAAVRVVLVAKDDLFVLLERIERVVVGEKIPRSVRDRKIQNATGEAVAECRLCFSTRTGTSRQTN